MSNFDSHQMIVLRQEQTREGVVWIGSVTGEDMLAQGPSAEEVVKRLETAKAIQIVTAPSSPVSP